LPKLWIRLLLLSSWAATGGKRHLHNSVLHLHMVRSPAPFAWYIQIVKVAKSGLDLGTHATIEFLQEVVQGGLCLPEPVNSSQTTCLWTCNWKRPVFKPCVVTESTPHSNHVGPSLALIKQTVFCSMGEGKLPPYFLHIVKGSVLDQCQTWSNMVWMYGLNEE
jgi:hypothetical protein